MPLYMDRHDAEPGVRITPEDVAEAHMKDVEVQAKYGVRYISYWFDPRNPYIFCLVDAPSKDSAELVHREAHGMLASKIMEVDPHVVERFLGGIVEAPVGEPRVAGGLRTILVTDIEGSTELVQRLGDDHAIRIIREHEGVINECLRETNGRLVKGLGDGVLACFESVVRAVECSLHIQQRIGARYAAGNFPIRVRIGLAAGEPVTENDDLYGAAVTLAARVCGACEAGTILATGAVHDLSLGKGFSWQDRGDTLLKGFDEPVRLYAITPST